MDVFAVIFLSLTIFMLLTVVTRKDEIQTSIEYVYQSAPEDDQGSRRTILLATTLTLVIIVVMLAIVLPT